MPVIFESEFQPQVDENDILAYIGLKLGERAKSIAEELFKNKNFNINNYQKKVVKKEIDNFGRVIYDNTATDVRRQGNTTIRIFVALLMTLVKGEAVYYKIRDFNVDRVTMFYDDLKNWSGKNTYVEVSAKNLTNIGIGNMMEFKILPVISN